MRSWHVRTHHQLVGVRNMPGRNLCSGWIDRLHAVLCRKHVGGGRCGVHGVPRGTVLQHRRVHSVQHLQYGAVPVGKQSVAMLHLRCWDLPWRAGRHRVRNMRRWVLFPQRRGSVYFMLLWHLRLRCVRIHVRAVRGGVLRRFRWIDCLSAVLGRVRQPERRCCVHRVQRWELREHGRLERVHAVRVGILQG